MKYLIILLLITSSVYAQEVKQGQTWVHEYYLNDPFRDVERDTCYVLDVKNDYVQFKRNDKVYSLSEYWFLSLARLIEEKKVIKNEEYER